MLTPDDGSTDGKFVGYLNQPTRWAYRDPDLFWGLKGLLESGQEREVAMIERASLLGDAGYFSRIVPDQAVDRRQWFQALFASAAPYDLVFLDPDNGLEVKSKPYGGKSSSKFLYWREVESLWSSGKSLLIYQHFIREKRAPFVQRMLDALASTTPGSYVEAFSTPHVVFLMALQPAHQPYHSNIVDTVQERWEDQIKHWDLTQRGAAADHPTAPKPPLEAKAGDIAKKGSEHFSRSSSCIGNTHLKLKELLEELEQQGKENDAAVEQRSLKYLNITRDTGEFLAVLVEAAAVKQALEIGTSNGYSTLWIASALPDDGHMTTLEIAPHKIDEASANFKRANLDHKINLVQASAADYLRQARHQFDLVFLDADRSSYIQFAENIVSLVRPGGLLVCDNAVSHAEEMKEFINFINNTGEFTTATVPVGKGEFLACKHA